MTLVTFDLVAALDRLFLTVCGVNYLRKLVSCFVKHATQTLHLPLLLLTRKPMQRMYRQCTLSRLPVFPRDLRSVMSASVASDDATNSPDVTFMGHTYRRID